MTSLPFDDFTGPPAAPPPEPQPWVGTDPRVVEGNRVEARVVELLDERGWDAAPFGIQTLPPSVRQAIVNRQPATQLRALPDLAVRRRHDDLAWLVEVKAAQPGYTHAVMECRSLAACQGVWQLWNMPVVVVFVVGDGAEVLAAHVQDIRVDDWRPDGSRRGTGTPFVRIPRDCLTTLDVLFGATDSMHAKAAR